MIFVSLRSTDMFTDCRALKMPNEKTPPTIGITIPLVGHV
jgi:hypothetical protein